MSKISIIIPVYNGEKYLADCLNSVVSQKFRDLEIIIVDDGSNDNSANIIKSYERNDQRVKGIYKKNAGVSSARNVGIKESTGDYIVFVDCDDVIHEDYCRTLHDMVRNNKCECAFCGKLSFKDEIQWGNHNEESEFEKDEIVRYFIANRISFGRIDCMSQIQNQAFVQGIYDASLIREKRIMFPENVKIGEDWLFLIKYLLECNRIASTNRELYGYRNNENSVMNSYKEYYLDNMQNYMTELKDVLRENIIGIDTEFIKNSIDINAAILYLNALTNYRGNIPFLRKTIKNMLADKQCFFTFFQFARNMKEKVLCVLVLLKLKFVILMIYK